MSDREQQKEQLRAERLGQEAEIAQRQRRRRLVQLGSIAVLGAICVVAVLIVISQSSKDSGGDASSIEGASAVTAELRGIPQAGTVLGEPAAPVTVTEFGDLQCPVCKQFADQTVPELISGPIRSGEAKYDFQQWAILGDDSSEAAKAALAAGEQGRYFEFVSLFYRNQGIENSGYVTDDFLEAVAEAAGVPDLDAWNEDRSGDRFDDALDAVDAEASKLGLTGTPSLLVAGPGGQKELGPSTFEQLQAAIQGVS